MGPFRGIDDGATLSQNKRVVLDTKKTFAAEWYIQHFLSKIIKSLKFL